MLLDGEFYTLRLRWNERDAGWRLHIGAGDGTPIAHSIALRADTPIQAHLQHLPGLPPGIFACIDTTNQGIDPEFDELGDRVQLYYIEEADILELGA
jgi:hypothetical protein